MSSSLSALYLPAILKDIRETLRLSEERFGPGAADRYAALIRQALRDLHTDPCRPGAKSRNHLATDPWVYHLVFSRDRVAGDSVKKPRHFVLYRFNGRVIEFARILHDSRDPARHLPRGYRAE